MKTLKLLTVLFLAIFAMVSCKKDEPTTAAARFEKVLVGTQNMEILKDNQTSLNWVNDTRGCFAGIITPTTECGTLVFAGKSDWRIPTPTEMSELITEINSRGMKLNYINTSCSLMSTSMPTWVMTENSSNPGQTTMAMPGNAGLRCVRTNCDVLK